MVLIHNAWKIDEPGTAIPVNYKDRTFLLTAWHVINCERTGGVDHEAIRLGGTCDDPPYAASTEKKDFKVWGCKLDIIDIFSFKLYDIAAIEIRKEQLQEKVGVVPFEEHQLQSEIKPKVIANQFGFPTLGFTYRSERIDYNNWLEQTFARPCILQTLPRDKPDYKPNRKINDHDRFYERDEQEVSYEETRGISGGGVCQFADPMSEILDLDKHLKLVGICAGVEPELSNDLFMRTTSVDAAKFIIDKRKRE